MVTRKGGYYVAALTGAQAVTQGDLLYPTIFNVVLDAVVRNWVSVMVEGAEERGGNGQEVRNQNFFFYTNDGIVALLYPRWIQNLCRPVWQSGPTD